MSERQGASADVQVIDLSDPAENRPDGSDLAAGLCRYTKQIPTRYGYDEVGSQLFEKITELSDYYLPRLERELLRSHAADIAAAGVWSELVELGSGSSRKTRILMPPLLARGPLLYTPIDISRKMLVTSAREVEADHEELRVRGIAGSFGAGLRWLRDQHEGQRLIIMLGSTFGNMSDEERAQLLVDIWSACASGDHLLLAADLVKPAAIIERAYRAGYEDRSTVRSRFALNRLEHINRRFDGDFDTAAFEPRSNYDPLRQRVEAQLESTRVQTVILRNLAMRIELAAGEVIIRDVMKKFTTTELASMMVAQGFAPAHVWTDPRDWYGVFLYRRP